MLDISNIKRYKNKNAYYANAGPRARVFISYDTIIAVSTAGTTYITSGYYSTTTSHHKTDARRLFNNPVEIEVKPETIPDLITTAGTIDQVNKEQNQKKELITFLKLDSNYTAAAHAGINIYNLNQVLKNSETGETRKEFKNGNILINKYYRTNFKLVSNFNFKITTRFIKTRIPAAARAGSPWSGSSKTIQEYIPTIKAVIYS